MKTDIPQAARDALGAILDGAAETLAGAGVESPRLDAELLMAAVLDCERIKVLAGAVELSSSTLLRYQELVARRASREPLAYIVGRKEFFSLDLEVSPAVLIPRPETELVVAAALEEIAGRGPCTILDLGTGSGAIALAIAAGAPHARIVATDVSEAALEVARGNACRLGLEDRVEFRISDCWEAVPVSGSFNLVVSNPPYIEDRELAGVQPEIGKFEPRLALAGGADGLDFYRRIGARVREFLKPGGALIVEIGERQAQAVTILCREAGCVETAVLNDLAGRERVVRARFA